MRFRGIELSILSIQHNLVIHDRIRPLKILYGHLFECSSHKRIPEWSCGTNTSSSSTHCSVVVVSRPDTNCQGRTISYNPRVTIVLCSTGFCGNLSSWDNERIIYTKHCGSSTVI